MRSTELFLATLLHKPRHCVPTRRAEKNLERKHRDERLYQRWQTHLGLLHGAPVRWPTRNVSQIPQNIWMRGQINGQEDPERCQRKDHVELGRRDLVACQVLGAREAVVELL